MKSVNDYLTGGKNREFDKTITLIFPRIKELKVPFNKELNDDNLYFYYSYIIGDIRLTNLTIFDITILFNTVYGINAVSILKIIPIFQLYSYLATPDNFKNKYEINLTVYKNNNGKDILSIDYLYNHQSNIKWYFDDDQESGIKIFDTKPFQEELIIYSFNVDIENTYNELLNFVVKNIEKKLSINLNDLKYPYFNHLKQIIQMIKI